MFWGDISPRWGRRTSRVREISHEGQNVHLDSVSSPTVISLFAEGQDFVSTDSRVKQVPQPVGEWLASATSVKVGKAVTPERNSSGRSGHVAPVYTAGHDSRFDGVESTQSPVTTACTQNLATLASGGNAERTRTSATMSGVIYSREERAMTTDDKNGVMSQLLVNGETGYNRGDQQHQLAPTLLPEAVLLPSSGDLGLNGFSPGPGQDTYAAKFRSPCARSIEEEVSPLWKMTGEEILPSPGAASVKTASSFCWGDGGVGGEELSRETGRMIGVWAEEEQGDEEDRVVETEETTGREAEGKEEGGEAGEKKEKGKEEQEQEQESDDGYETEEEKDDEREDEYYEAEGDIYSERYWPVGEGSDEERTNMAEGIAHGLAYFQENVSMQEATVVITRSAPDAGAEHTKGSATSHFLGINGAVGCGGDSSSGRLISGDSEPWGVDENPRLDDYFRGQPPVPPSEGELLPPPFDCGVDGSPLFPSPPSEGKALYGLSTWSFASDAEGEEGSNGDGAGFEGKYGGGNVGWTATQTAVLSAEVTAERDDRRVRRGAGGAKSSTIDAKEQAKKCSTRPNAEPNARANPLPRRGRCVIQPQEHQRQQQESRTLTSQSSYEEQHGKDEDCVVDSAGVDSGPSVVGGGGGGGGSRRRSNGGNTGGGGIQKRHQEWLDKFGEEKRLERQEEEAKAQRRQAARRRTRDLLLERAKQRLHDTAATTPVAATTTSTAGNPDVAGRNADGSGIEHGTLSGTKRGSGGGGGGEKTDATSGDGRRGCAIPLYAQETTAARHSKVERKGEEKEPTPEEKKRLDKERFDRIAATRRRQKEQHKLFLAALKTKRLQDEEEREEQERKEAEKRNNVKMWAERRLQHKQKNTHNSTDEQQIACDDYRRRSKGDDTPNCNISTTNAGMSTGGEEGTGEGVAGSGLNAIRSAIRSRSLDGRGVSPPDANSREISPEKIEEDAARAVALERENRKRRSLEEKMAKERVQKHLESLRSKQKVREEEEESERRRQARRMSLLRTKVLEMARELRESGKAEWQRRDTGEDSSEEEKNSGGVTKARLTDIELQASVERLTQQRKGTGNVASSARDFNDWKRKHGVSLDTKVFVMTGWYPCVKTALLERGWAQNSDRDSPYFDLKWTLHSQDMRTTSIQPWQLCNHFFKNVAITTKAGLLGNMRSLKWLADRDCSEVFPRGYDLSVEIDVQAFLDDYCVTAAESLLKHVFLRAKGRGALRLLGSENNDGVESLADDDDEDDVLDDSFVEDGQDSESGSSMGTPCSPLPSSSSNLATMRTNESPFSTGLDVKTNAGATSEEAVATDVVVRGGSTGLDEGEVATASEDVDSCATVTQDSSGNNCASAGAMEAVTTGTSSKTPFSLNPIFQGELNHGPSDETQAASDRANTRHAGGENGAGGMARRIAPPVSARRRPWEPEGTGFEVNAEILAAALAVCRRRQVSTGDGGLDADGHVEPLCSDLEWELIGLGTGGGVPHPDMPGLYRAHTLSSRPATPIGAFMLSTNTETTAAANANANASLSGNTSFEKDSHRIGAGTWEVKAGTAREERRRQRVQDDLRAASAVRVNSITILGEARLREVESTLEAVKASFSQFDLNGDFCQNMWIVKPAAKSRGRGIECFTELDKLLGYTETRQPQAVSQWVVHKYMENPLIIARRKFDLRQWVVVTDWNPLTVWFYDKCYVRFGVEEYTTSGSNIGNNFVHLVNNSICKKSDKFGKVARTENGFEVHEHMWSNEVFAAYVDDVAGEGCWRKRMQPRMEQIVTWSLLCGQDMVEHRKNSWELYGYDFMVDEQYKPWLIEINSSPACDYSTKVTEQYVQSALTDLLKVTVDLPAWEASRKNKTAGGGSRSGASGGGGDGGVEAAAGAGGVRGGEERAATTTIRTSSVNAGTTTTTASQPRKDPAGDPKGNNTIADGAGDNSSMRCSDTDGTSDNSAQPFSCATEAAAAAPTVAVAAEQQKTTPPDTGLWRLLYKGAFVPFPVASFGTDLLLKGTQIRKPSRGACAGVGGTGVYHHAVKL